MANRNDRARLGEQPESDRSSLNNDMAEENLQSEEMSADSRQSEEAERMVARPTEDLGATDETTGDEGVDDAQSQLATPRGNRISRNSGMRATTNRNARSDSRKPDVRERSTVQRGKSSKGDSSEFEGQGGQKEGDYSSAQGTGYTNDRTGQLQEDDSLSGTQGRHGTTGNRQGSGTSDSERVGGQTAQNPRGNDDIDRSVM